MGPGNGPACWGTHGPAGGDTGMGDTGLLGETLAWETRGCGLGDTGLWHGRYGPAGGDTGLWHGRHSVKEWETLDWGTGDRGT